ncbi:MAG: family 78 glycoside hydrolase catalytic domain [Anaerolineae bacterium]
MLTAHTLRTEYAENPLGIATAYPRLSWQLKGDRRGIRQTAYQIRAGTSVDALAAGEADLWDSGKVVSADQIVPYHGPLAAPGVPVWWEVRAWDADDVAGPFSDPAWFERALDEGDWEAGWIGYPVAWPGQALMFRTTFTLTKPVRRARAYVVGLGYYELHLNGVKVGDHVLDPGTTSYDQRVLYATYDVTDLLYVRPQRQTPGVPVEDDDDGINVIGAIVGHGWYGAPKLRLELRVTFEDGSTTEVLTRSGPWQVGTGPILKDSIYGGEIYDARLAEPGWCQPGATEKPEPGLAAPGPGGPDVEPSAAWARPITADPPGGRLVSQTMKPIRVVRAISPIAHTEIRPGITVYDLGQNFAGWARIRVRGDRGSRVMLRFAESCYPDGTVNQENLRSAAATDLYVLSGDGEEMWEPRFTYHGFRYVQVELSAADGALDDDVPVLMSIEGCLVRSDTTPAGEFSCRRDLLNAIHNMVWWTEASNQHGIPTDCPQRDERMGWLNDLGTRAEEAIYNFDVARFFSKWVADIHDAQDPRTGAITDTAPFRWGNRPADPVSVSYLLIPWLLYRYYGDIRTMDDHYDGLKGWVDFLSSVAEDHVVTYSYYGDWAPPVTEAVGGSIGTSAISSRTPGPLISTGYYHYTARLLSQMAQVLGKDEDAESYAELADDVARVYHDQFYDPETGGYGSNNQACNAFSLYMGLVPTELRDGVIENLVQDVEHHGCHLTTGNLCTKYLLEVLTDTGHADVAYHIATQQSYPSWGYMLSHGATTVWERWEHATGGGMNSHSHPMLASVGSWLYKALAGITIDLKDVADPAFARFSVRPRVVGDLTGARATLQTVKGTLVSDWALLEDQPSTDESDTQPPPTASRITANASSSTFTLHVVVPVGAQADVSVLKPDDSAPFTVREGETILWDGGPADTMPGITAARDDADGAITFTVGSGAYTFIREPKPKRSAPRVTGLP